MGSCIGESGGREGREKREGQKRETEICLPLQRNGRKRRKQSLSLKGPFAPVYRDRVPPTIHVEVTRCAKVCLDANTED